SGNYDYPPASRRTSRGSRGGDRPPRPTANRLQHLRDLLNSERNRSTSARALETLNQEIDEYRSGRVQDRSSFDQTRAAIDRQIQHYRSRREHRPYASYEGYLRPGNQGLPTLNVSVVDPDTSAPDSSRSDTESSRHRSVRGGARPAREVRNRGPNSRALLDGTILDEPVPYIDSPTVMPQEAGEDRSTERWRVKRRKLESDDNREGLQSFRYGQYGQVVPGALKMELASCDGGNYEPEGESSWPENVLRNDSSVYCTKSDRCNLVLKHCGEAPFCLKKIVIKAPKNGIQEGMVFVAMTSDELLSRTAQYQIQYRSRRHRHRRSGMQPSQEYLSAYRTPLQTLERGAVLGTEPHSEPDTDISDLVGPYTGSASDPMSEFRVTTEYDERPGNNETTGIQYEDLPSIAEIERLHMNQMEDDYLCTESENSESDDDTSELGVYMRRRRELQRRVRVMRRQYAMEREGLPRQRPAPSTIQPVTSNAASSSRNASDTPVSGPQLLKPHARFFIERSKSMVSIKFDPPPSGRYILIKLWSPHNGSNIDVQSIIAHGFAGPRFFPSQSFR
ncbi:hypothetical protein FE257_005171, partial [Aspergillus nanangensis]